MLRLRLLAAAALSLAASAALALPASAGTTYTSTTVTFKPAQVGWTTAELGNSGRGQYAWLGSPSQVDGWPVKDVYYRDQVYFGRLAPTDGAYDFRWIEDGLQRAESMGGRFGFRVMTYCPGCWMTYRSDFPAMYPAYMPRQAGTDTPDWNHEGFLRRWEALMAELGRRYGDDPRLAYVDVGGYGLYGEWHVESGAPKISDAAATRVIKAVLDAFPKQQVLINAMSTHYTDLAMRISPRLGLRTDCLGEYNMFSAIPLYAADSAVRNRWKTAPVLSEWCGSPSTDFVAGAKQVSTYHVSNTSSGNFKQSYASMSSTQRNGFLSAMKKAGYRYRVASTTFPRSFRNGQKIWVKQYWSNMGSAPTYDAWRTSFELWQSGRKVSAYGLRTDLRGVLPGTRGGSMAVRFSGLTAGTYQLRVRVADAKGYLPPMRLSQTGRQGDGSYVLGNVTVTG